MATRLQLHSERPPAPLCHKSATRLHPREAGSRLALDATVPASQLGLLFAICGTTFSPLKQSVISIQRDSIQKLVVWSHPYKPALSWSSAAFGEGAESRDNPQQQHWAEGERHISFPLARQLLPLRVPGEALKACPEETKAT